jgi:NAD(P)-dependent dehydrogenase (short-subunit alcohol dehydrogenase family)
MTTFFTEREVPDQSGKTVFITGANTGIGFHAARVLAENGARVLLGCRSNERAEEAMATIKETAPQADLAFIPLDLGDLKSIDSAVNEVAKEPALDLLINNAGIMGVPKENTKDGFESHFGINHLGPFALTSLLLDQLIETPNARIISTSSLAHRFGSIDFDDIQGDKRYFAFSRYGMSKLANLLHTYELQRRLEAAGADTLSLACHPGIAESELSRHMPDLVTFTNPLLRMIFNTSAQGAWPTLMAATDDDVEGGTYFGPAFWGETSGPATKVRSNLKSHDPDLARELWDLSSDLTGVDPGI